MEKEIKIDTETEVATARRQGEQIDLASDEVELEWIRYRITRQFRCSGGVSLALHLASRILRFSTQFDSL